MGIYAETGIISLLVMSLFHLSVEFEMSVKQVSK